MHSPSLVTVAVIAIAAALGALLRYGTVLLTTRYFGDSFPIGTLLVNLVGCFVIGLAHVALESKPQSEWLIRHGLMIGLLGSLTTFSAFSLDTMKQLQSGQLVPAAANVLLSVVGCLAAVWLGMRIGREIW